ncbi:uncharacterized protein LOC127866800 isoform X2 [Dreissena polymorpha]|uniref:FYVE-type domain-containing protein n=1 Tax=Dreissena polymorpha TaxID=45954 RepID=A0A9D4LUU3_DREPO|nr:uncharacterized protein LOC127866800 isoform X2 [Dreissena polymorpha]KAH3864192.1 hypothetical protein DPMN_027208 [Dreissena polymorpha]
MLPVPTSGGLKDNITNRTIISICGEAFIPAVIEGDTDPYTNPNFFISKRSWQPDQEALICPLCRSKFGALKRRHHCRQCGLVVCDKCNEKLPLPQLNVPGLERVCESCKPVTAAVTRSRSHLPQHKFAAVKELSSLCKDERNIDKMFKFGGFHTLVAQAGESLKTQNMELLGLAVGALNMLSTFDPVRSYMVQSRILSVLCHILEKVPSEQEQIILDGVEALTTFCRSPKYRDIALKCGCLTAILRQCSGGSETVSLTMVGLLGRILEDSSMHGALIQDSGASLQVLLKMAAVGSVQMQALTLKCLNYLSMGSDWNKHRILQEDFTAGRPLLSVMKTETLYMQVWVNATCLVANLATSAEDQGGLVDCRDVMIEMMISDVDNIDVLRNIIRGISNFSKFQQNSNKVLSVLHHLVEKCLRHKDDVIRQYALKAILFTVQFEPEESVRQLLIDGAAEVLQNLVSSRGVMNGIISSMAQDIPDLAKPL